MTPANNISTWRCHAPPHATVEVLQSSAGLLDCLLNPSAPHSQSSRSQHRKLLILFPGNPGLVHFYQAFCEVMDREGVDVVVMGFAGHSLQDLNGGRLFSLQDQIDCADMFTKAILGDSVVAYYTEGVFVAGHSIGGYVGLHVLARHPEVKLYFGLCPVLSRIMESPNGQRMFYWGTPVLQWLAAITGSCFALLPQTLRSWFVKRHADTLDSSLQEVIAQKVSRHVLLNVFYLSFDEFRAVIRPDAPMLHRLQSKMALYYVPGDEWAPPKYAEEIKSICPNLFSYVMEEGVKGVPHAWCLQHNAEVAEEAIMKHIRSL